MNDIWNQLEADFESQEAAPIELPSNLEPEVKGFTPKERLQEWMLNGTIPVLIASTFSLLLLFSKGLHSGFGLELLLALPIGWLCRSVFFAGRKMNLLPTMLSSLTVGAFIELLSTGTHVLGEQARNTELGQFHAAFVLQQHLESFFSPPHIFAYILLGILIHKLTSRAEKRLYWMDVKPPSKFRLITSRSVVIGLPVFAALVAAWFLSQHSWTTDEQLWLSKNANSANVKLRLHGRNSWSNQTVWTKILESIENENRRAVIKDTETVLRIENAVMREFPNLLKGADRASYFQSLHLLGLLAQKLEDTQSPERVALALTLHPLDGRSNWNLERDNALADGLLPYLSQAPLTQIESMEAPFRVEDCRALLSNYRETASDMVYFHIQDRLNDRPMRELRHEITELPKTMKLMSIQVPVTPIQIAARRTTREELHWWLRIEDLTRGKSMAEAHRIVQKVGPPEHSSLAHQLSNFLDPDRRLNVLLDLAYLIPKLREHHAKTGEWPDSLPRFAEEVGVDFHHKQVEFDSKTGQITYKKTAPYQQFPTRTWTLK